MFNKIIAIFLSYLLGSILPAYFLAKWLKKIDIRTVGTGNPGTTNIANTLGFIPAVPTAIYDLVKGVLAILIAKFVLQTPLIIAYLAGFTTIIGHIFPFYLHFKGGQGAATCTGIVLYNLYQLVIIQRVPVVYWDLVILILVILIIISVTRIQEIVSVAVLPLFAYFLIIRLPFTIETISTLILIVYLLGIAIYNIVIFNLYTITTSNYPDFRMWRTLIRPAAMSFPVLSFFISKTALITLIVSVLTIFFITDLIRIINKRIGKFFLLDFRRSIAIYKDKEALRISSMTLFLLGCFLSFLLFERPIAVTSIVFLIFGDLFAKILGLAYSQHKLFNKTWEGSLAHFLACMVFGYVLHIYINIPLILIFSGAFIATLIEALPFNIDDNLSVPVITGAVLTIGAQIIK